MKFQTSTVARAATPADRRPWLSLGATVCATALIACGTTISPGGGAAGGASGSSSGGSSGGLAGASGTGGAATGAGGRAGGAGGQTTGGSGGRQGPGTGGAADAGTATACTVGAWPAADPSMPGPFTTVTENNVGPAAGVGADGGAPVAFTLFRPANLAQGGLCHPVVTWGNGTGSNPS